MAKKPAWTIEEIEQKSRELGEKIRQSGFKPDLVVGIKFGGHIVGRHVAEMLGVPYESISVKRLLSAAISKTPERFRRFSRLYSLLEDFYYKLSRPFVQQPLPARISGGHKVLLVDDDVVLYKTIGVAKTHLRRMGVNPRNLKVASLNIHPKLKRKPDFFLHAVDVVFPWSIHSPHYEAFKKSRYARE